MATEFKLPEIGEGVVEGEIIKWLVAEGDEVVEDTPLVEVMTDKATVEVPSPQAGTVLEIRAQEGEIVDIGAVIMVLGVEGEPAPAEEPPAAAGEAEPATPQDATAAVEPATEVEPAVAEVGDEVVEAARAMARAELEQPEPVARPWEAPPPAAGRALAAPAIRRLARELGVDLMAVAGTGKGGRVVKDDVLAFAERATAAEPVAAIPTSPPVAPVDSPVTVVSGADMAAREERIPVRGLRRLIAQKMSESKTIIPHFTYVEECDMTQIVALRRQAKEMGAEHGVKVTFLPFIVQAMVAALKRHPIVNSSYDEAAGEIVVKHYYNVGIATATERGLMVPVVKNADQRGIFDLAREIGRVAGEARAGKSQLEDLQDGTITITSTGNVGGVLATPIINHPEVAIIGVTAIRKRPVVKDDEIVVRDMVNLSLTLDHRIVDGFDGALFLRDMISYLEDPKLLLLGAP